MTVRRALVFFKKSSPTDTYCRSKFNSRSLRSSRTFLPSSCAIFEAQWIIEDRIWSTGVFLKNTMRFCRIISNLSLYADSMHISPNLFCPFYCPTICVTSLLKFCFRTVSDSSNSLFRSRCSFKLTLTWSTSFSNSFTEWTFYISSFFNTSLASSSFFFVSRSIFGILFTRYSVWSNLWRSSKFSWH